MPSRSGTRSGFPPSRSRPSLDVLQGHFVEPDPGRLMTAEINGSAHRGQWGREGPDQPAILRSGLPYGDGGGDLPLLFGVPDDMDPQVAGTAGFAPSPAGEQIDRIRL